MTDLALSTPLWLAASAIAVSGLVGALRGYTDPAKHWDVVGVLAFALLMGLGGGFVRDMLLGLPAQSLQTPWPVAAVVGSVVLARLVARWVVRIPRVLGSLDALALGLYAMSGTATAVAHGLPAITAVLVGVLTGVGGGVLVSVLRGEVPVILQPSRPYALIAALVGAAYLLLAGWSANGAYVAGAVLGVALFLLAERHEVRTRPLTVAGA